MDEDNVNSSTSVVPNIFAWEQQEWKTIKKQRKMASEEEEYGEQRSWHEIRKIQWLNYNSGLSFPVVATPPRSGRIT